MNSNLLHALLDTPLPGILVGGGMIFILLAVAGSLTREITIPQERQSLVGILGAVFMLCGISIQILPRIFLPDPLPVTPTTEIATQPTQVTEPLIGTPEPTHAPEPTSIPAGELPSKIGDCSPVFDWDNITDKFNVNPDSLRCKNIEGWLSILEFSAEAKGDFEGFFHAKVYDHEYNQICYSKVGDGIAMGIIYESCICLHFLKNSSQYKCEIDHYSKGDSGQFVFQFPDEVSKINFQFTRECHPEPLCGGGR